MEGRKERCRKEFARRKRGRQAGRQTEERIQNGNNGFEKENELRSHGKMIMHQKRKRTKTRKMVGKCTRYREQQKIEEIRGYKRCGKQ